MKIAQQFKVNSLTVALHAVKFSIPASLCSTRYKWNKFL